MKKHSLIVVAGLLISTLFHTSVKAENEIPKKKVVCNLQILVSMNISADKINEKRCEVEFFSEAQRRAENYLFYLPSGDRERTINVAKNICSILNENEKNMEPLWKQVKNNFISQGLPHQKDRRILQISSIVRASTYWFCPEQTHRLIDIQLKDEVRF